MAEKLVAEEVDKNSPVAGTGEWLDVIDWFFRLDFC
jgi:hypothetical protein